MALHSSSYEEEDDEVPALPMCSLTRFESGSSCDFDQTPSMRLMKSRTSRSYLTASAASGHQDMSQQSFEFGVDPIERDWGDSMSRSVREENHRKSVMAATWRYGKIGCLIVSLTMILCLFLDVFTGGLSNGRSRRRSLPSQSLQNNHGALHRTTSCDAAALQKPAFGGMKPEFGRRGQRRAISAESAPPLQTPSPAVHVTECGDSPCSTRSLTNSSCSSLLSTPNLRRNAPERRTPIPREPSLYVMDSSSHSGTNDHDVDASCASPKRRSFSYCGYHHHNSTTTSSSSDVLIDIAPGVTELVLRGSDENYQAVSKNFYTNTSCSGCSLELCCIADALYVLCPTCKVISPLKPTTFEGSTGSKHGLGLGFNYESLFHMQVEIMKSQSN